MCTIDLTARLLRIGLLTVSAALAVAIGGDTGDAPQAWARAEHQARVVEILALSSVAGSIPQRAAVRKAQAAAIAEARRVGMDLSIASVGSGGSQAGDAAADGAAFARLVERFPETRKATPERDDFRERLAKAWNSRTDTQGDGLDRYNATAQVIADPRSPASACVVEFHAGGESLRAILAMKFHELAIDAIERRAHRLDLSASDVAFLVAAHESSHCVIGMARRVGLLDTRWADPSWDVPRSWTEARSEDDEDLPALAKAEESAADLLAVMWAADALGIRKARNLARLSIYAVSLGARPPLEDGLHDSSRALARLLARSPTDSGLFAADATRTAWSLAAAETRAEVFDGGS
jgi:hypothetical protein